MTSSALGHYLLRWTDAAGMAGERELNQGRLLIGRALSCDVVLSDGAASRQHARITVQGDQVLLEDLGSSNGTYVNGRRVTSARVGPGDEIRVGGMAITLVAVGPPSTRAFQPDGPASPVGPVRGDYTISLDVAALPGPVEELDAVVPEAILRQPVIDVRALLQTDVEVKTAEYAALGGGLGSFTWVDFLRSSGVSAGDILVAGIEERPHGRYERLCADSQIPHTERLRSNSDSCPDNVWGFPGYAVREAWRELKRGNVKTGGSVLWGIFGEPAIAQTYTPRAGDVFRSIECEMERIGWRQMLHTGRIRAIRKSSEGRLLAVISASDAQRRRHFVVSARFLHLAIGYPAIQLLPDLAEYREKYEDRRRVVNAYENHDHVYAQLRQRGGTVIIRGRGIVASRIIQRLWEERRHNQNIRIIHLQRSRLTEGHRYGSSRRVVRDQFELQPFNWPKACWGGELRQQLEESSNEERKRLLDIWGGTTTADRSDWRRMIATGLREGWYRTEFGVVREVKPMGSGVATSISSTLSGGGTLELSADFIIDCTGLVASPDRSPLISDMIKTYNLPLNKLGRLQVTNDFEVEGMRHGEGRLYASGAITLGGPYAAVDSFLGLQYAALAAMDSMRRASPRPKGVRRLNGLYSFWQWLKWARGVAP